MTSNFLQVGKIKPMKSITTSTQPACLCAGLRRRNAWLCLKCEIERLPTEFPDVESNDFERVITDHKSWHTNLGVPNWDVIKSHLLLSQLKTIELAKESFEKRVKNNETKSDDYALGYDKGLQEVITLLDTIIQKIKSQIK